MAASVDYYELLGVGPEATADQVRAAYRRLAKSAHPDAAGTAGLFRLVREAYEVLSDPARRARYDQARILGQERESGQGHVGHVPEPEPDYVPEDWPSPGQPLGPHVSPPFGDTWPPTYPRADPPWNGDPGYRRPGRRPAAPEWKIARWKISRAALAMPLPGSWSGKAAVIAGWLLFAAIIPLFLPPGLLADVAGFVAFWIPFLIFIQRAVLAVGAWAERRRP